MSVPTSRRPASTRSITVLGITAIVIIVGLAAVCLWLISRAEGPADQAEASTSSTATAEEFTADEQAYIKAVAEANVVTAEEYADLVAAATEWCTRKDPVPGPANATLHDQIEARYPVAARANSHPLQSWSMLAQDILCPGDGR